MQHITLHKIAGERYDRLSFKVYEARRDGETVGTIALNLWNKWEVVTPDFQTVSQHTTIKAAVRVADRALTAPLTVIPCSMCDGVGGWDGDDTDSGCACIACGGTGNAEVCAGCGTVPTVRNGLESCHCAVQLGVAA
jgi:RecJ-like exonuclease